MRSFLNRAVSPVIRRITRWAFQPNVSSGTGTSIYKLSVHQYQRSIDQEQRYRSNSWSTVLIGAGSESEGGSLIAARMSALKGTILMLCGNPPRECHSVRLIGIFKAFYVKLARYFPADKKPDYDRFGRESYENRGGFTKSGNLPDSRSQFARSRRSQWT
jgi:hypothetical protein